MSRSLAAAPARRSNAARSSRRAARRPRAPASGPSRALSAAGSSLRRVADFVARRRRLRIALLVLAIATPLLAAGWLWFRQSPFVSIQRVQISGVHGADAPAVEAALTQAARAMSTLDVNDGALRAAVAPLRIVREVRAIPRFPHALRIDVVEQLPVASLTAGGVRTALAADGVVLGPAFLSSSLPSVSGADAPAAGGRVGGAGLLGELTVLGAAPALLAKHVERAFTGAKGLTVAMRNGLLVYFGDDARPHAKWTALVRVLADPSSAGASYIDVRLPSHPAAGFPAGVSPPDSGAATGAGSADEQPGGSESTVASLAAGLAGGSGASSSTGESGGASGASTSLAPSETPSVSQTPAAAGTEASPGAQAEGAAPTGSAGGG